MVAHGKPGDNGHEGSFLFLSTISNSTRKSPRIFSFVSSIQSARSATERRLDYRVYEDDGKLESM